MTQVEQVAKHLNENKSITSMEAFIKYGITRLSSIIFILRNEGMNIHMERINGKNRYGERVNYGEYSLVSKKK